MTNEALAPWYSSARPDWERCVNTWLTAASRAASLGEIKSLDTVKERPWSLVRRVTFEKGQSYFKACSASGKHEPALHQFLEEHFEIPIPQSQAVELEQGWILTAGAGAPLPQTLTGSALVQSFAAILTRYADMQIASLSRIDQLLDIGLPDRRLNHLPQRLETLLSDLSFGASHNPDSWHALRAAALAQRPRLEQVCRRLDRSDYAAALDHGDLHAGNLLVSGDDLRLCDWGDACITHPFCSLLVSLEMDLDDIAPDNRPKWTRYLRDAYLRPWTALAPRHDLLADFHHALWLAHLLRALNFAHMFRGAPEEALNRWRPLLLERIEMWIEHQFE